MVTVAFGLMTYFFKKEGGEKSKRPVALDPQKKIPFKLIDKKVLNMRSFFYCYKTELQRLPITHDLRPLEDSDKVALW